MNGTDLEEVFEDLTARARFLGYTLQLSLVSAQAGKAMLPKYGAQTAHGTGDLRFTLGVIEGAILMREIQEGRR